MRRPGDEGAATVLALGLCTAVLALSMVVLAAAGLVVTRHRAESAADLAALSAARRSLEGERTACSTARSLAQQHGARLDSCRLEALDVVVQVSLAPPGRLGAWGRVRATARAGVR